MGMLLTEEETDLLLQLRVSDFELFRQWFWSRRDDDPDTPGNPFREEFRSRLATVSREFGDGSGNVGWKTAPGVIYLLLGKPDGVGKARGAVPFERIQVWSYARSARELGFAPLNVYFGEESGGKLALLTDDDFKQIPRSVRIALDEATEHAIRHPDLPFPGTVGPVVPDTLPLDGELLPYEEGVEARVILPLAQLYGRPMDGPLLKVELELRLVAAGSGAAEIVTAIPVVFLLHGSDLLPGSDRVVRVLARFRSRPEKPTRSLELWVEEVASGRTGRIVGLRHPGEPEAPEPGESEAGGGRSGGSAIGTAWPVERILAARSVVDDDGVAVAYLAAEGDPTPGEARLWLVAGPANGKTVKSLGQGLRLIQGDDPRAGTRESSRDTP